MAKIALVRFGCPPLLADYLVNRDIGGLIFIRSPLTQQLLERLTKVAAERGICITDESLRKHPLFKLAILALRGIAQGGVESCIIWNATFDILLVAITSLEVDWIQMRKQDGSLARILPTAFADDFIAMVASLVGLQRVADMVCAFSIVFGFDIRGDKLRAFLYQWGRERDFEAAPTLVLHH